MVFAFTACHPYREILLPLQNIPANCHCRYKVMAKHYYNCTVSELERNGLAEEAAIDSAVFLTHRIIATIQIQLARDPDAMARFCDCYQANNPSNYATPSPFDEDVQRAERLRQ